MVNEVMKRLGQERSAIRELFEYGNQRAKEIGRENVFDFSIGNPSVPAPDCVREEAERLLETVPAEALHGYSSAPGIYEVRTAVADYIKATFGVPVAAENVYLTAGAAACLTISFHALCEEGDEFIVVAPYFPEYKVFIEGAGAKIVEVPADSRFHLDIGAIGRAINVHTKGVVINSPNNPTGAVYGEEELAALGELLARKSAEYGRKIFLISDEPYRELTYGAAVPYPMNYYDDTIVCYSFSKSLSLPGERIGYIAVNPRSDGAGEVFAAVCGAGRKLGFVCAPTLFQRVIASCLGKTSDISVYAHNCDLLYRALTDMGYECILPEGAFYLFVKSLEPSSAAFCERAKRRELLLVSSESFGVEGYVRISYCVPTEMIERSLPAFEALAKEYAE